MDIDELFPEEETTGETGQAEEAEQAPAEQTDEQKIEAAAEQHEKDGTWPDDTPGWMKKRVNREIRKTQEAKLEAERLRQENADLAGKLAEKAVKVVDKPKMEDFEEPEEYYEALSNWTYEKRDADNIQARDKARREADQATTAQTANQRLAEVWTAGEERFPDYAQVVSSVPASIFTPDVAEAIFATENADEVTYHLAKNLQAAERLAGLGPAQRAVAIGQISARLAAAPTKKASAAPTPITPVGGRTPATGETDSIESLERILAPQKRK